MKRKKIIGYNPDDPEVRVRIPPPQQNNLVIVEWPKTIVIYQH